VLFEKFLAGGPKAVRPEDSYHCYGRAIDWVNIKNADAGEKGVQWNNDEAYAEGTQIAIKSQIRGIGASDNDHLQDANFANSSDLLHREFGNFPRPPLA